MKKEGTCPMIKKLIALVLTLALLAALPACGGTQNNDPEESETPPSATFTENAVTAYRMAELGGEEGNVQMLVLVGNGWIMDVSLGLLYSISDSAIEGLEYEALSDDVFRWKPSEQALAQTEAENTNVEMRIVYSDPDGRFIVYSPNVERPDMANIIMNPAYFSDVADMKSVTIDKAYHYFYKISDPGLLQLSRSMNGLPGFDDYADMGE